MGGESSAFKYNGPQGFTVFNITSDINGASLVMLLVKNSPANVGELRD